MNNTEQLYICCPNCGVLSEYGTRRCACGRQFLDVPSGDFHAVHSEEELQRELGRSSRGELADTVLQMRIERRCAALFGASALACVATTIIASPTAPLWAIAVYCAFYCIISYFLLFSASFIPLFFYQAVGFRGKKAKAWCYAASLAVPVLLYVAFTYWIPHI